ncbi:MAG: FHA domain-containing protein [Planctomycetales bacterium]|nr:FHA domain-containing protein [Planctomycetales bacterium]
MISQFMGRIPKLGLSGLVAFGVPLNAELSSSYSMSGSLITLQILDGADRGRVFSDLQPPVTIGREEGNSIQLNDDRVSRFHVKIQEDHDHLVLTDLESTNGTKVNGEDIQLRILRFGDMINVGRSLLLFGNQDQIAERLRDLRSDHQRVTIDPDKDRQDSGSFFLNLPNDLGNFPIASTSDEAPALPERLSPGQAAQLAEVLEFLHGRIRHLFQAAHIDDESGRVDVSMARWQAVAELQHQLAAYLRMIGDPS